MNIRLGSEMNGKDRECFRAFKGRASTLDRSYEFCFQHVEFEVSMRRLINRCAGLEVEKELRARNMFASSQYLDGD